MYLYLGAKALHQQQQFVASHGDLKLLAQTVNASVYQYAGDPAITNVAQALDFDVALCQQPLRWQDYQLLVSDMDSTLITIECIDRLAEEIGRGPEVAAITERSMQGEFDFTQSLLARIKLLRGLPQERILALRDQVIEFMPGAPELMAAARKHGLRCILVSGGFTIFSAYVATQLGLKAHFANELAFENFALETDATIVPRLNGKLTGALIDAQSKADILYTQCAELSIQTTQAIALGDGANDLPMMNAAGLAIGFRAKPIVQRQVDIHLTQRLDSLAHWFDLDSQLCV